MPPLTLAAVVSSSQPLRLNGASFRAEKTRLVTIVEPWEVHTLAEVSSFTPEAPLGLPITERNADEFVVGTWTLWLTYEGQTNDGEVS